MAAPCSSRLLWSLSIVGLVATGCGPESPDDDGSDSATAGTAGTGGTMGTIDDTGSPTVDPGDGIVLSVNRDVDILFVIDNSGSMGEEQAKLASSIDSFLGVLEDPTVEANYRIGITTSDNGNPWCQGTGPEAGMLRAVSCRSRPTEFVFEGAQTIDVTQQACYDLCPEEWGTIPITPTELFPGDDAESRNWMEFNAGQTNLPDGLSMAQAFQCLGPQGINGCGFESPLESMWKTLRRSGTDADPDFGFVRDSAVLSIIHVTDEADCSYNNEQETIFLPDGDRVFWSDPRAPAPTSAVCWNAGVACSGSGTYDDCVPVNLDPNGNEVGELDAADSASLRPMSRYIDYVQEFEDLKQLITPGQEVVVALLGGVNSDGTVTYQDSLADPDFQNDFGIGPGCQSGDGSAVPPVRLRHFAEAFQVGGQGSLFSICDADYSPALQQIATQIADQLVPACMPACVADTNPATPGTVDPQCTLLQESPRDDGGIDQLVLSPCNGDAPPAGQTACFQALVGDAMDSFCADQGFNLQFRVIRTEAAPPGTTVQASCELSTNKAVDCPLLP